MAPSRTPGSEKALMLLNIYWATATCQTLGTGGVLSAPGGPSSKAISCTTLLLDMASGPTAQENVNLPELGSRVPILPFNSLSHLLSPLRSPFSHLMRVWTRWQVSSSLCTDYYILRINFTILSLHQSSNFPLHFSTCRRNLIYSYNCSQGSVRMRLVPQKYLYFKRISKTLEGITMWFQ